MGKRANSEGSIYFERDRKKWCAAIPLPDGKVKRLRFDKASRRQQGAAQGLAGPRRRPPRDGAKADGRAVPNPLAGGEREADHPRAHLSTLRARGPNAPSHPRSARCP